MDDTSPDRSQAAYALAAAALALTMWSGTAVANKVAVSYMSGLTVGILRSLLAGIIALGVAFAFRLRIPAAGIDRILLVGSGLASFAVWPALVSIGVEQTTASHTGIIMALIPISTVLIAHLVEGRTPAAAWWPGAGAAYGQRRMLVEYVLSAKQAATRKRRATKPLSPR